MIYNRNKWLLVQRWFNNSENGKAHGFVTLVLMFVFVMSTVLCIWSYSEATAITEKTAPTQSGPGKETLAEENNLAELEERFRTFWELKVMTIDQYPITVRKIVTALIILIIGILVVRALTVVVRQRLLPRTHFQETTAAIIEKMFYYFFLVMVVLFSLRILNVPLHAFAFLGGALAIGVGFGAQNLVNNFISGFILMAERPIKLGDLVEVDGDFAVVEEIGARCTRIRTGSNVHILVPNSSFLEKNIINWTLSDQRIRTGISVGVIYGSPVREVERLLLQAANDHSKVIRSPEPFVLFSEFGDNALIFELFFWIRMTRLMERRRIESDMRFHIDQLCREAGIVIAFPQRDVHLDTVAPLEVRVVDGNPGTGSKEMQ